MERENWPEMCFLGERKALGDYWDKRGLRNWGGILGIEALQNVYEERKGSVHRLLWQWDEYRGHVGKVMRASVQPFYNPNESAE